MFKTTYVTFHITLTSTGGRCPIPMDTTFIIGSSAIACSDRNWIRLLDFVQILVRAFGASPSGSHFALIPYSTDPELVLKFNSLTGSQLSVSEVNRQVARLRCQRGFNRIDKALELADKEVLTKPGGMRDGSRVSECRVYDYVLTHPCELTTKAAISYNVLNQINSILVEKGSGLCL